MTNWRNYDDATNKNIIRPQKAKIGCEFDVWVTKDSPKWQRQSFVQLRRYQALECRDHMRWDTSDEGWKFVEILSLTDYFFDENRGKERQWLIGAICFINRPKFKILEYCWIHPFWRNKGLLKSEWPLLQKRFGSFEISHPRSKAMQCFLKSVGYTDPPHF